MSSAPVTASTSTATDAQDAACRFLDSLSSLRPAALPALLKSSAHLPAVIRDTLAWLAGRAIAFASQQCSQGQIATLTVQTVGPASYAFVELLINILQEGDPTLIRALVPQATTLLHLVTVVCLAPRPGAARDAKRRRHALSGLRVIFRRTLRPEESADLVALVTGDLHGDECCATTALTLSSLLRVIPKSALSEDQWSSLVSQVRAPTERALASSEEATSSGTNPSGHSLEARNIHLQDAALLLNALHTSTSSDAASSIASSQSNSAEAKRKFETLQQALARSIKRSTSGSPGRSTSLIHNQASGAPETPNERVQLDALLAVLPHIPRSKLLAKLRSDVRYAAKSNEQILELLLDDPDGTQAEESPLPASQALPPADGGNTSPVQDVKKLSSPVRESRARFHFDPSRFLSKDADRASNEQSLSADLKRITLARAEASSSDESDDNGFGIGREKAVGFEEELETEIEQPQDRRRGISKLFGGGANASRFVEDYSTFDEDSDAEDKHNEDHEKRAPAGAAATGDSARVSGGASNKGKNAVSDTTTLQLHFLNHGPSAFARNDTNRSSKQRRDLLASLGGSWDHALVEDWGTVFARDPKRDKTLSRLASSNIASTGPSSQPGNDDSEEESGASRFGPDRGRGGRVLRGARGGAGRGRGGSAPPNGSHESAPKPSRGRGTGHSGTDRGAKRKERQGNAARTRGHDRKMNQAGGAGGFA